MKNTQLHSLRKPAPLFIRHQTHQTNNTTNAWLDMVKASMLPHLDNMNFKIADLATELHYSERSFFRKVKKLSGSSANVFIRNLRLERAKELLLSGEYHTLKEVAYQVGYLRVDYFSNLFEAKYQQRPKELLERYYC